MGNARPKEETGQEQSLEKLDLTGRRLDDFELIRRLGQGGMGQVYLAEQVSLKRRVALKVLRPDLAENPNALQRFRAEAEAVARATHANIVQVYAAGVADGIPYIALEYVEGRNLREYLLRKGPPEPPLALSIMRQVCSALQRAGEMGIIHRDIKPDNILLTRRGEVKVTDFGLSRILVGDQPALNLTQSGMTLGTPLYMSPEQVEGKPLDIRSDIYSFGVTCYHMLAGQPPFLGSTAFEVALQHVRQAPTPLNEIRPDLPIGFCAVVHKMMAKDPTDRYQTGAEALRDLALLRQQLTSASESADRGETAIATSPANAFPSPHITPYSDPSAVVARPRRRWLLAAFIVSCVLATAVGGLAAWFERGKGPANRFAPSTPTSRDQTDIEAIFSPRQREEMLKEGVKQYLNTAGGVQNVDTGFGLCLDLGLFYLENGRLEDAQELFTRLTAAEQVRAYHILGLLGTAIVKSLRAQSTEEAVAANQDLTMVSDLLARDIGIKRGGRKPSPETRIWANITKAEGDEAARLRYWLVEAMHYNEKNGVPEAAVSPRLKRLRLNTP
jgi:serine/threonine-protein kinase